MLHRLWRLLRTHCCVYALRNPKPANCHKQEKTKDTSHPRQGAQRTALWRMCASTTCLACVPLPLRSFPLRSLPLRSLPLRFALRKRAATTVLATKVGSTSAPYTSRS